MSRFVDKFESYDLKNHGVRLPIIDTGGDNFEFLCSICDDGCQKKIQDGKINEADIKKYSERCAYELKTLKKHNLVDYFLLIYDVLAWCDNNNIPRGFARGSSSGSLVFYLMGCNHIDPIKHDLPFTRFISEARLQSKTVDGIVYLEGRSLPDFDADASYINRDKILQYIDNRHPGKTSKILTVSTLSGKILIKDCCKIFLDYSEDQAKRVSDTVERVFGKVQGLCDAYQNNEEFKKWAETDNSAKECYRIALSLEGLIRGKGQHPSGIAISFDEITSIVPLELSNSRDRVSAYPMDDIAEMMVKLDILGLKNTDVNAETCSLVGRNIHLIDINDPSIYRFFELNTNFYGLFQISEGLTKKTCIEVKPKNIDELACVLSLSRPGSFKDIPKYLSYKRSGVLESIYPAIDKCLSSTANIIIYQEQINQICIEVYGFDPVMADQVRYCVSGDTYFISKDRGYISIDDLLSSGYSNELFLVMDECGNKSWQKIKNIWATGKRTVNHVTASNGLYVKATNHHQFLTDTGWKTTHWLKEGEDYLVFPKKIEYNGFDGITCDLAILIAGIVAEGYFSNPCRGHFTNYDRWMMDVYLGCFQSTFLSKPSISKDYHVAYLHRKDVTFLNRYIRLGKSESKELPDVMMGMTIESTRKFLSFILACEGGISKKSKQFEFSSKSRKLVQQIQLLLLRFGVASFVSKKTIRSGVYAGNIYHRLYVLDYQNQIKLRDELTCMWPVAKIADINFILTNPRSISYGNHNNIIPQSLVRKFLNQYSHLISCRRSRESGSIYKNNVTKIKLFKYAKQSGDRKWINLLESDLSYSKLKSKSYQNKEVKVYDFTIDNDETPFIIANGLVIHNCVGKKREEDIKKFESILFQKGVERGIPEDVTRQIWQTINDSANYLFSKNHAYAYSYTTALNTYLKTNHTKEFFLACLKLTRAEPDPTTEIQKIQDELRHYNIRLLGPDIANSQLEFSIEGNNIRFGLKYVKGISDKTIEKLIKFKQAFNNKFEIFTSANEAGLNQGVLAALIQAGSMDNFLAGSTRSKTVLELQLWSLLTDREKKFCLTYAAEYNYDLLKIVIDLNEKLKDEKGKPIIKDSRRETIRGAFKEYQGIYRQNSKNEKLASYFYENKLLGYSYSQNLTEILKDDRRPNLMQIVDVERAKEDSVVEFCGQINEVYYGTSRAKGTKYCKLTIKDTSGAHTVLLFTTAKNDRIKENEDLNGSKFEEDQTVVVRGRKKTDSVFADLVAVQNVNIYTKLGDFRKKDIDRKEEKS